MTIQEIFNLGLDMAITADPRGAAGVKKYLARRKKDFDNLSEKKKAYFDKDSLINPYSDSAILVGDGKKTIKRVLVGIDMNSSQVLLADRLTEKGTKIDAIITHHPASHALAALHEVMDLQIESMAKLGIPVNVAEGYMQDRMAYVARRFHPDNHGAATDTARLLGIPYLAMHTIWDNLGYNFVQSYIDAKKDIETVGDLMETLMQIPEYQESTKLKAGPYIAVGSERNRVGKIAVGFTGGTEGPKEMFEAFERAGVGTLVDMHLSEDHIKELKNRHMNAIVAGHMASDSIGANIFLDQLEARGIEAIACSGLIRIKR